MATDEATPDAVTDASSPDDASHGDSLSAFDSVVGHLLRRAQQLHASLWAHHVPGEITSTQYAVLTVLALRPGIDQVRVSRLASLDTSTTAELVRRLVKRGLVDRTRSTEDTRKYVLHLTSTGTEIVRRSTGPALRVNEKLLSSLSAEDAQTLLRLLHALVDGTPPTSDAIHK